MDRGFRNKWKNIVWGLLFLAAAAFIVLSATGVIHDVNFFKIIFAAIFGGIIISSIPTVNFAGMLFPLAFICIMFSDEWGLDKLTPWPVLAIALLGSIGLSLIFKNAGWHKTKYNYQSDYNPENENWNQEVINDNGNNVIYCDTKFNGEIKYIKSENLTKVNIRNTFGGVKLYFEGSQIPTGHAEILFDSKFGGVELFIPKDWKVINGLSCAFGGIEEKNHPMLNPNSPEVVLKGSVSFSGVTITYI